MQSISTSIPEFSEIPKKIVVFGASHIGKTAILRLVCEDYITRTYKPTIGFQLHRLKHSVIWDIAGHPDYFPSEDLLSQIMQNTDVVIHMKKPSLNCCLYPHLKTLIQEECPQASLYSIVNTEQDMRDILKKIGIL
jgi:GTPase SAR1 family protein